jgi:hypothetical protein
VGWEIREDLWGFYTENLSHKYRAVGSRWYLYVNFIILISVLILPNSSKPLSFLITFIEVLGDEF